MMKGTICMNLLGETPLPAYNLIHIGRGKLSREEPRIIETRMIRTIAIDLV